MFVSFVCEKPKMFGPRGTLVPNKVRWWLCIQKMAVGENDKVIQHLHIADKQALIKVLRGYVFKSYLLGEYKKLA